METVADMNVLYKAFKASMKSSAWKNEPQRFETDFLSELTALQDDLTNRTYKTLPGTEFSLNERGKIRHIHGGRMRDRVVRHALCDAVLNPALEPYLVYNNGASQKNKGVSFARERFERDLHNFYLKHRTNDGYVCFVDFSKFYDNIQHEKLMNSICQKIDEHSAWLLREVVDGFKVDVSYMTDKEYADCMNRKFDSIAYFNAKHEQTGKKYMRKSVDIGDQVSQTIGVFFPTPIDNYATIVRGHRWYGRYMDDMYIIHHDKKYLLQTLYGIYEKADELGLYINRKKTRLCRLSDTFVYLQIKYFLTESGKVVKRINPKAIAREHRKLRAYKRLMDKGIIAYQEIENTYKSWMGSFASLMSKKQISNMKTLYKSLFGKEPRWKKLSPSYLQTKRKSQARSTETTTSQSKTSQQTNSMTLISSEQQSTDLPWKT